MGFDSVCGRRMVVKNTFLECIHEEEEFQPQLIRARTDDPALRWRQAAAAAKQGGLEPKQAEVEGEAAASACAANAAAAGELTGGSGDVGQASGVKFVPTPARARARQQPRDGAAAVPAAAAAAERTTMMLRNLPNDYNRTMLLQLLDQMGFAGRYDFAYLPTDFARQAGLGYAFVNLISSADVELLRQRLEGFRGWIVPSSKTCTVGWSDACQGLEANVERYRSSPIMHESVPDESKPAVFKEGTRAEFPQPTKRLRKPDLMKQGRPKGGQ